ncbi:MAG: LPS export ABC transporter periplasmic protein LptC [Methylococcaceae bacterium]|nr:LPS export ABC transporter periplasmic protein LptC [Methylococcaceae bacterium]
MDYSFTSNRIFLQNIRTYALALVLAGFSWWAVEIFQLPDEDESKSSELPKHSPDYFSKGYLKKEMDEQGLVKSKLFAEEMLHYSDDGVTHMTKPEMTFYNADTPPWIIKSESGTLSVDGKDLLLNGQVFVNRNKAENVKQLTIETTNLRVKTEESYAEGDEWAKLSSPPNWAEGIGIQMIFQKPISLKLLANVKSYYERN